jgi:hypothetical protein
MREGMPKLPHGPLSAAVPMNISSPKRNARRWSATKTSNTAPVRKSFACIPTYTHTHTHTSSLACTSCASCLASDSAAQPMGVPSTTRNETTRVSYPVESAQGRQLRAPRKLWQAISRLQRGEDWCAACDRICHNTNYHARALSCIKREVLATEPRTR